MKKMGKIFLTLLFFFFSTACAFAIDPFEANKGGFGPNIKGIQLGMSLSMPALADWAIQYVNITDIIFRVDNYEGKGRSFGFTVEKDNSLYSPYSSISDIKTFKDIVKNNKNISDFTITVHIPGSLLPREAMLADISISVVKNRVSQYSFSTEVFDARGMDARTFAQNLVDNYDLGSLEPKKKDTWEASYPEKGWKVVIDGLVIKIFPIEIPGKGNFSNSNVRKPKEVQKEEQNAQGDHKKIDEDDFESVFPDMRVARIKGNNVNVRREPNKQGKVMFLVNEEDDLLIVDKVSLKDSSGQNWHKILYRWIDVDDEGDDAEGGAFDEVNFSAYINEQFIKIEPITEELKAWLRNI